MLRNHARNDRRRRTAARGGFTLVEMLVVVMILGLLSGMVLLALAGAGESAREARTRGQIQKLHEFVMNRYESYRTRRTPRPTTGNPRAAATARVDNIRALMLQELPDRRTDLATDHRSLASDKYSATYARHQRAIEAFTGNSGNWANAYADWSPENQHAECLYLILASINDGDTNALDFLHDSEIGDTDGDGVPEVLDGWGNPIMFLRWPQGYVGFESSLQDIRVFDAFDPLRTRTPLESGSGGAQRPTRHSSELPSPAEPIGFAHFNMTPLIVSAGKDGAFDIAGDQIANAETAVEDYDRGTWIDLGGSGSELSYPTSPVDPYFSPASFTNSDGAVGVGVMFDVNDDGYDNTVDNISNHYLIVGGNAP